MLAQQILIEPRKADLFHNFTVNFKASLLFIVKKIENLMTVKLHETSLFILVLGLLIFEFYLYDFNLQEYTDWFTMQKH